MYLQPSRRPRFAGWWPRPNPGRRLRPNRPPRAEASAPRGWIRSRAQRRRPRRPRGQPAVSAAQNRPGESMGCGAYKELILRFSKLEDAGSGFRSGLPGSPASAQRHSRTTSPKAMRRWTFVILILTSSPIFVPGTKTTKFAIRASPSPSRPISSILASYTFPSSTGTFEGRKPDPEYDIHDSMRRPSVTATLRIGCTVYNDIGVGPRSDPWTSRLAQRVQVFLDIRGSGEPQAQDQTDDPDDQHDESDRGHEPVPRAKGIEGGEFADADPELVMEPRSQCNPGAAEEDQEDARVEEELLAETGLPLAPFVIVGFVGCHGRGCSDGRPGRSFGLEEFPALGTLRRIDRNNRLAGRALRDETLRRGHG